METNDNCGETSKHREISLSDWVSNLLVAILIIVIVWGMLTGKLCQTKYVYQNAAQMLPNISIIGGMIK